MTEQPPPSTNPTSTFPIHPLNSYNAPGAKIKRPVEIAHFSYDSTHTFHANSTQSLRYFYTPPLGVSLSEGFESFEELDDGGDEHLEGLLGALVERERREGRRVGAAEDGAVDVVTWRGMGTKIMTAPYSKQDGFEMNATYFQGTIFIEESHEYKLESRKMERVERQPQRPGAASPEMMSYWGYKFETLCLLPDTWDATPREYIENRTKHVVNNHAQYCSIVQTSIGGLNLILGGEVDAVWDIKPTDLTARINWVELKTSAELTSASSHQNFERKLLKFWAQSFLLGVPKIIVGFRNGSGTLMRIQEFETTKIPKTVREQGGKTWESNVCINFLAGFLEFLQGIITTDGVWKIKRRARSPVVEVYKHEETGHGNILTPEFIAWRKELADMEAAKAAAGSSVQPKDGLHRDGNDRNRDNGDGDDRDGNNRDGNNRTGNNGSGHNGDGNNGDGNSEAEDDGRVIQGHENGDVETDR